MTEKGQVVADLVLLSGGLDSTVALTLATEPILALSVDYGQRHAREVDAARTIAGWHGAPHAVLDLTGWGRLLTGSALTDPHVPVPGQEYDEASMALTVVPNRNATFLMAAVGVAMSVGADRVVTAIHSGDHHLYADTTPEFLDAARHTAEVASGGRVTIDAPFVGMTKADIVTIGDQAGAPVWLSWSCYQGGKHHCGACGTCRERREAFILAGVSDPTIYKERP